MTDQAIAPAGESAPAPASAPAEMPASFTPSEAGRYLAEHAKRVRSEQASESAAPATEAEIPAQAENAAPLEEVPGEAPEAIEPADTPPIEPPRSWTKEQKERWQSLPRETQEYLSQREQERDRELRRSQNEAAEQRKAIEAERKQAEQARQQYESQLPILMQTLQDAQAGAFGDIRTVDDVTKLAQEDPFRYLQWQAHQTKMQAVNSEMQRAEERKRSEQQSSWTDHVQKESEAFRDSLPDADKAKLTELQKEAPAFLETKGFTQQELNDLASGKEKLSIYDRRVQSLILDGLKYQGIQKAKATVAAKPVPPVQKPGVARPQGAAQAEALQTLHAKLDRSGDPRDAARLIAARLRAS